MISQAAAFASNAGSTLGSGGAYFPQSRKKGTGYGGGGGTGGDGAGGASSQGGAGGAGKGGHIHVSDTRNPPDYGRIAFPEDIFGSLEVDGEGNFVDGNGHYQESGSYRMLTREGWYVMIHHLMSRLANPHSLGLSPYLHQKLVEKLREEEMKL